MNASVALSAHDLTVGYGARTIVAGADLAVPVGTVTTLIGPNGSGKSTLLRAIGGLSRPQGGSIRIEGVDIATLRPKQLARKLAMLPQSATAPEGLTVADLVSRGRQPHQPWYRQWSVADEAIVEHAMRQMDVDSLAETRLEELSGGQRQRAWIAMSLAQDTPVLVLDEPTTHLDLAHAVEILAIVRALAHDEGRAVLMVLHDLALAARCSDYLAVVADGALRPAAPPTEVLTEELLASAFALQARVFSDPVDGAPTIAPLHL